MARLRDAQAIELFHLAFLQVLAARLAQARYTLKGGANLRYFFRSVRYSEDIDLDTDGIETFLLEKTVDGVLDSRPLQSLLASSELALDSYSKPKQTQTTQRWKAALSLAGRAEPLRTKIEFSRRNGETRRTLERVPEPLVAPYGLRPPTVMHYTAAPATEQKIAALAGRSETQARDVFDLELLLRGHPGSAAGAATPLRQEAAARALDLPYAAFADQVAPFLDPEFAEIYDEAAWQQIQSFVVERLLEDA